MKRARGKALAPDEYNSGTFTISNLGMFGAQSFDAILPPGESSPKPGWDKVPPCRHERCMLWAGLG